MPKAANTFAHFARMFAVAFACYARPASADGNAPQRPPMPEPIFTETVTDIDGHEAGEVEFELNGSEWRALHGGAYVNQATVETEWLVTRRLGVRVEPFLMRSLEYGDAASKTFPGVAGGVSWKLIQDFRDDFHLQAEAGGRYPSDASKAIEPGESASPLAFDLRAGLRNGAWTVRSSVGVELGGSPVHAPVRGSVALFTLFGPSERYGFWGFELDADAARRAPAVVALNIVPNLTAVGLPFTFGLAVPWAIGTNNTEPSLGVFLRVFILSAREVEYGRAQTGT